MWSSTGARTVLLQDPELGAVSTDLVWVLFHTCSVGQRTKEILIPYKFCSVQARPSLHFASKPQRPSDFILFPKKTFLLVGGRGGQHTCSCFLWQLVLWATVVFTWEWGFFHFVQASNANTCFVFHVKICWAKIYSCTLILVDCILCKYLTCLLLPCSL